MNKYLKVDYKLYTIDAEGVEHLEEHTKENEPYQFISGLGMVLEDFEENLQNLQTGDKFDFVVKKERAYGDYEEEHVVKMPREAFCIDGHFDSDHIFPGADIPLMNADGLRFDGIVREVGDEVVCVDLNHPLAGCDLYFTGHILESRDATPEEMTGALNRMSGEGCGCGCGDHDCECGGHHDHNHDCKCGGHKHGDGHCGCGHHH